MIGTYLIIAVLLLVAELIYFRIADKCNIIDKPNERSSHKSIVLRGGGIIFPISMIVWSLTPFPSPTGEGSIMLIAEYWPFILGLLMIAGVSFIDDIHSLPDSVRLVFQFAAMFLIFYGWGILNWESWWMIILGLILCVGITNVYNFMDGINGINGGYTLAVLLPLAWLNHQMGFVDQSLIVVALLADLVFCFFNYRPKGKAKCFAGDVGSIASAFIVIYVLGRLILTTGDFTYIVFLVVYGVDACLTICHRIMLHENLGQAHRKHAYQLMANELGMEHTVVSTIYTVLQLAIAAGMIMIPNTMVWHWGYLIGVTLVLTIAYILFMRNYYHLHEAYLASLK
jgi:UDP-N-acetylmuramyl pentapeptide phosphotransferase/UDP-N-acetylglucosamine-1-phosphate transferase